VGVGVGVGGWVGVGVRELWACPDTALGLKNFFLGYVPGPWPKGLLFGPEHIFSFNQIQLDFSLKYEYNEAKVNV
jgi:hypothetical protein